MSVNEESINLVKYAVIYSMIVDLMKDGTFTKEKAEIVNNKCAESCNCKPISLD